MQKNTKKIVYFKTIYLLLENTQLILQYSQYFRKTQYFFLYNLVLLTIVKQLIRNKF